MAGVMVAMTLLHVAAALNYIPCAVSYAPVRATTRRSAAVRKLASEMKAESSTVAQDSARLQGMLSRARAANSYLADPAPPKELATKAQTGRVEGAALMFAVAVLWGSNFPAVKATIEAGLPGSAAAASRFSIAALALLPLLRTPTPLPPDLVRGGLECGAWLALGYIAQALALQDLPAGAVAFLASLQVVFVPMLR